MKNIQVIDDAINTEYAIYSVTEEEFLQIFHQNGQDIEFIEDLVARIGDDAVYKLMQNVWPRKQKKSAVSGIHGTLFYGLEKKKKFYPEKRGDPINWRYVPD